MGAPEPQARTPQEPASQARGQEAGTEGRPSVGGAPARAEAITGGAFRRYAEALLTLNPYGRGCEEVVVEGGVAKWMLGSTAIVAVQRSLSGRALIIRFEDPGDNHRVARRFNAVLHYLRDTLGIEHGVSYRVVNVLGRDSLDYLVYVRVGNRKFRGGRLTVVADLEARRAEVFADEDEEVVFFSDPGYEELGRWIREALKTWESKREELSELVIRLRDARVPPELVLRLRELLRRYNHLSHRCWRATLGLLRYGDWVYGARVKYLDKIRKFPKWVAELMELRRELEEIAARVAGGQK
jgi:hypothetical protein